jgi:hypothetical protein
MLFCYCRCFVCGIIVVDKKEESQTKFSTMRYYFTFILSLLILQISAQEVSRNTITTAGDYTVSESGVSLSWSIGEVFGKTTETGNYVTEGFQQGILEETGNIELKAKLTKTNNVEIQWEKLGLVTTGIFVLERKVGEDGDYRTIAIIRNDDTKKSFNYTDKESLEGKVDYRIGYKKSGESNYSNIGKVEFPIAILQMNLFPNPSVELINIEVSNTDLSNLKVKIFQSNGQLAFFRNYELVEGELITIKFDETFETGSYIVQLLDDEDNMLSTKQFVKF